MIVRKYISVRSLLAFAGHHIWWLVTYMTLVAVCYKTFDWHWISIPWLPVSLIGTAVAFYVGFKNNQAYDRIWEARKIWGGIVNSSRSWGNLVDSYIQNSQLTPDEIKHIKKRLIYRHIAWLYTFREQLLIPTAWEHISLGKIHRKFARQRIDRQGVGQFKDYLNQEQTSKYFAEIQKWEAAPNQATYITHLQSQLLASLEKNETLNIFRQIEMQKILTEFNDHQGKAERIKKFPLPRQYANLSFVFNCIFIFLLPLGIVGEFAKIGESGVWLMIPFGVIVGWIYVVMELIGDYSENPFEGFATDIPMLSICRTIEIDLLKMLGETNLPQPIQPVNEVLM